MWLYHLKMKKIKKLYVTLWLDNVNDISATMSHMWYPIHEEWLSHMWYLVHEQWHYYARSRCCINQSYLMYLRSFMFCDRLGILFVGVYEERKMLKRSLLVCKKKKKKIEIKRVCYFV